MDALTQLLNSSLQLASIKNNQNSNEILCELNELQESISQRLYSNERLPKHLVHSLLEKVLSKQLQISLRLLELIHSDEDITVIETSIEQEAMTDNDWVSTVFGEWKEGSSGGCLNESSWRENEQYLLKIEKTTNVEIVLEQLEEEIQPIGFYIFEGDNYKQIIGTPSVISKSPFKKSKFVSCAVELTPNSNGYVILPCTFYPHLFQSYKLTLGDIEKCDASLKRVTQQEKLFTCSIRGNWSGKTAGGCRNNLSWIYNPQFYISSYQPNSKIHILVEQKEKKEFNPLGMYLLSTNDSVPTSKIMNPSNLAAKSEFLSECESYFITSLENFILIPCTFDPNFESSFQITIYSNSPQTSIRELLESNETKVNGAWKGITAGGSPVVTKSWRNNPQYQIHLKQKTTVTIRLVQNSQDDFNRIGFFIFKNSCDRKLIARQSDLLASSDFVIKRDVTFTLDIKESENLSFIVMPCTHERGQEGTFDLSIFVPPDDPSPTIQTLCEAQEISIQGSWTETTAGGRLTHKLWRNNPQYIISSPKDIQILLCLSTPEEQKIGFYITNSDGSEKIYSIMEDEIVKKAPFRKSTETYCSFHALAGQHYNIIPCTFAPGVQSSFSLTAFALDNTPISLTRANELTRTSLTGEWRGLCAGGCINNRSWWKNPRYRISTTQDTRVDIVLVQMNDVVHPIGYYLMSEDYCIKGSQGIITRAQFEPSLDVSLSLKLNAGNDYILIPSTFHAGEESPFEFYFYSQSELNISPLPTLTDEEIDSLLLSVSPVENDITEIIGSPDDTLKVIVTEGFSQSDREMDKIEKNIVISGIDSPNQYVTVSEQCEYVLGIPAPPNLPSPPEVAVDRSVVSTPKEPVDHLLSQIGGLRSNLRKVTEEQKQRKPQYSLPFAFNMEKIIARRIALEESDEEEDTSEDWF